MAFAIGLDGVAAVRGGEAALTDELAADLSLPLEADGRRPGWWISLGEGNMKRRSPSHEGRTLPEAGGLPLVVPIAVPVVVAAAGIIVAVASVGGGATKPLLPS